MKETPHPVKILIDYVLEKASGQYRCSFLWDFQEDAWLVTVSKIDSDVEPKKMYHRSIFYPTIKDAARFIESFITHKPITDSLSADANETEIDITKSITFTSPTVERKTVHMAKHSSYKLTEGTWPSRVLNIVDELDTSTFESLKEVMSSRFPERTEEEIRNNLSQSLTLLVKKNKIRRDGDRRSFTYITLNSKTIVLLIFLFLL